MLRSVIDVWNWSFTSSSDWPLDLFRFVTRRKQVGPGALASPLKTTKDTALECGRRRRDCQRRATELESTLERHAELERRLATELQHLENRVSDNSQQ